MSTPAPIVKIPFTLNYPVDGASYIRHILMTDQVQVNFGRGRVTLNIAFVDIATAANHPLTLSVVTDDQTPTFIVNFTVNGTKVASRTITTTADKAVQHTLTAKLNGDQMNINVASVDGLMLQPAPARPSRTAPVAPVQQAPVAVVVPVITPPAEPEPQPAPVDTPPADTPPAENPPADDAEQDPETPPAE